MVNIIIEEIAENIILQIDEVVSTYTIQIEEVNGTAIDVASDLETQNGIIDDKYISPLKLSNWWIYIKSITQSINGYWSFLNGFFTNFIQFNLATTTSGAVGKLKWNDVDGTLDLGLKGGNVTLQIGQETVTRIVNKTSTNITLLEGNYQAIRVTGAQGQRPKVDLAMANSDLNSATTLGLVTETILNNQEGFITTSGQVQEINTTGSLQGETWLDGDVLYLSGTVAGQITNIKPIAPIHTIIIGLVEYAHAIHGKIFVKVNNGYELEELHNVSAIAPNDNEVLAYDLPTLLWKPKTISSALGFTPSNDSNVVHLTGNETISAKIFTDTILAGSGSLAGSVLSLNQTWNTTGNPTALFLNVTNTASGSTSKLIDLQVGGNSKFKVSKDGRLMLPTTGMSDTGETLMVNGNSYFNGALKLNNSNGSKIFYGTNFIGVETLGFEVRYAGDISFSNTLTGNSPSLLIKNTTKNVLLNTIVDNGIDNLQVNGSVLISGTSSAISGIDRGANLTTTLTATANNDVLVGLDIAPTFNNGGFTGVQDYAQRINGSTLQTIDGLATLYTSNIPASSAFCFHFSVPTASNYFLRADVNNLYINAPNNNGNIFFRVGNTTRSQFMATTGNLIIQNGGTFTDIPTARLQVNSTTQGFLPPRMTNAQRIAISSPAIGLMVYCTDTVEGLYVNKSTGWTFIM